MRFLSVTGTLAYLLLPLDITTLWKCKIIHQYTRGRLSGEAGTKCSSALDLSEVLIYNIECWVVYLMNIQVTVHQMQSPEAQ